jgi:hypothetical protein
LTQAYPVTVARWIEQHPEIRQAEIITIEWPPERYEGRRTQVRPLAFCSGVWAAFLGWSAEILDPTAWAKRLWGHQGSESLVWQEALRRGNPQTEHEADAICIALAGEKGRG